MTGGPIARLRSRAARAGSRRYGRGIDSMLARTTSASSSIKRLLPRTRAAVVGMGRALSRKETGGRKNGYQRTNEETTVAILAGPAGTPGTTMAEDLVTPVGVETDDTVYREHYDLLLIAAGRFRVPIPDAENVVHDVFLRSSATAPVCTRRVPGSSRRCRTRRAIIGAHPSGAKAVRFPSVSRRRPNDSARRSTRRRSWTFSQRSVGISSKGTATAAPSRSSRPSTTRRRVTRRSWSTAVSSRLERSSSRRGSEHDPALRARRSPCLPRRERRDRRSRGGRTAPR